MKNANAFFIFMMFMMFMAFGILIESSINEIQHDQLLQQTHNVQTLYWKTQQLEQELSVCNWEVGKTQSIELIAPVTNGLMRAMEK